MTTICPRRLIAGGKEPAESRLELGDGDAAAPVLLLHPRGYEVDVPHGFPAAPSPSRAASFDLCQDFGHGSSRNQAAIGMASGLGSVLSKKAAMASAGTL